MRSYSTKQAARLIGVSWRTLVRWVESGKVNPSQVVRLNGIKVWLWTPDDVQRVRRYKAKFYWAGRGGYHGRKKGVQR